MYPVFLITLGINYVLDYQVGWFEGLLFICGYYIANITVGVGLHRLWSHDSYKINKYVEFILIMLSAGTLQGPALSWASNHFKQRTNEILVCGGKRGWVGDKRQRYVMLGADLSLT